MPPSGNTNQTLLDLIYALKSLAQQVEFYHQDLSRRLDEEVRARRSDFQRLLDISGKNLQSVSVLPITISDRIEKLLGRLESSLDGKFDTVQTAINEARHALQEYTRISSAPHAEAEVKEAEKQEDITGRIELTEKGEVRVLLNSRVLKKIWYGVIVIATGGGAYGFVELMRRIFSGLSDG